MWNETRRFILGITFDEGRTLREFTSQHVEYGIWINGIAVATRLRFVYDKTFLFETPNSALTNSTSSKSITMNLVRSST